MKKIIILIEILIIISLLTAGLIAEQMFFIVKATGYCPCEICCGRHADGFTAMMDKAGKGCIAIDPKGNFNMGDTVLVEGYGYGVFNDTGSAIKGDNRVDLCFETHQEALDWGVRYVALWRVFNKEKEGGDKNGGIITWNGCGYFRVVYNWIFRFKLDS